MCEIVVLQMYSFEIGMQVSVLLYINIAYNFHEILGH